MNRFLFLFVATIGCTMFADDKYSIRQAQRYGADTQIEVTVVHEDGSPVAGAEVKGTFPSVWNRSRAKTNMIEVQTDVKGQATLRAQSGGDVLITVTKTGYYDSEEVISFNTGKPSCVADGCWQPWGYPCKVVLKPKMFPRKLIVSGWDDDSYKSSPGKPDEKIGFDLERIDWVAPYGKGIVTDFLVSYRMHNEGLPEGIIARKKITLYFPNVADGAYRAPISTQSYMQPPHKAILTPSIKKRFLFGRI